MIKINSQKTQFERLKKRSGKNVEVVKSDFQTIKTTCIIKEFDNGNNSIDDKTIFFSVEDDISQGDIIKYENNTYIILLQQENINNVYCIYVMRRCDTTIKMYIDKKLYEIPCNIQTFTQDVFENKYLNLPSGNIKVTIQNNDISKEITYNKRFIKMGNAWKVVGFTSENKGLKYIYCEKTEINNTYDDIENEIADRWKYEVKHNYSMTIDTDNIEIEEGQIKQLIVNVTDTIDDKTETVENPILIYNYDSNYINVSDKGLIKGITEGETSIIVTFENIEKIINVKVVKPLPIVTEYQFKTITLDDVEFTDDTITIDDNTSKVLKVIEIEKKVIQGDDITTEIISNPIVAYSCNNSNITISEGKITGTNVGNSIVTVSYENIKKDINITVNDVAKLEIIGSDKIVQRKQRGEYTSSIPVTWSIEDVDNNTSTKWGIIISESENKCIVQVTKKWIFGDGKNKYIKLIAVSKDNSIVESKKIKISQF